MTKAELIEQLASECDISKVTAEKVLETFVEQVSNTLANEGRFAISGFGIFEVVERKERMARNPRTNEPIKVAAHNAIRFKVAKALKDSVNE